jgi:hypothetical protein
MDEVHVCVLRALVVDETPRERGEHALDLALLDHLTWPAYAWEFLRLVDDPLAQHQWAHRLREQQQRPAARPGTKGGSKARKAGAAGVGRGAAAATAPRRRAFEPLAKSAAAAVDAVLSGQPAQQAKEAEQGDGAVQLPLTAAQVFVAMPAPPPPPPEYYSLPLELKAALLSRLCDNLLDCPTIRAEVDRREKAGQLVAGKGGMGGAFAIMSEEERKAAEEKVGWLTDGLVGGGGGRRSAILSSSTRGCAVPPPPPPRQPPNLPRVLNARLPPLPRPSAFPPTGRQGGPERCQCGCVRAVRGGGQPHLLRRLPRRLPRALRGGDEPGHGRLAVVLPRVPRGGQG